MIHGFEAAAATATYRALDVGPGTAIKVVFDRLTTGREDALEPSKVLIQTKPADTPTPDVKDRFVYLGVTYGPEDAKAIRTQDALVVWYCVAMRGHETGGGTTPQVG